MGQKTSTVLAIALALWFGCGKAEKNDDKKAEPTLEDRAEEVAGDVRDRTRDGLDRLRTHARDKARAARDQAGQFREGAERVRNRARALEHHALALKDQAATAGEDAVEIIRPYVQKGKGQVEELIVAGKANAVQAARLAAAAAPALADGVGFRPIYIELGDQNEQKAIDGAIGNMPRVEVIDGLTVGFRAFTKRQLLVVWRQDDRMVGFVYTSLLDVAIEHVVEQAPRLIGLVGKALR